MRSNFHDQDFQVFANLLPVIRCHVPKKNSQVPPRLKVFRRQAPGERLEQGGEKQQSGEAQIKIVRPNLFSFPHQAILSQVQITFGNWKDLFTPEQFPYFPQDFPNWKISKHQDQGSG